jgi:heat shock protein HslJ
MTLVDAGGGSFAWNPPSAPITAVFGSDGRVGGFGGCNDYGGVYTTAGSSIAVTDVISTLKSCGDVLDAQERAFLAILGASSTFENTGTMLTILTGSSPPGKLVFRAGPAEAAPVPEAIAGDWSLIQMTKDGDAITLVAGSRPAAHFAADGNLSGTGGCNRYSGRYVLPVTGSISSGSLSIGPLATTMMACAGPVMTQEDTYLGILGNAASWEVDSTSGTLTLRENTTVENSLVYTKIP